MKNHPLGGWMFILQFVRFFCSITLFNLIKYSVFEYLPSSLLKELKKFGLTNINEIRIRLNSKVLIISKGKSHFLDFLIKNQNEIDDIVFKACNGSIYSHDEDIKNGFITTDSGERIGLAGEFVIKDNCVVTIRRFSSLVIRIPSQIDGVSSEFFNRYKDFKSLLVISKPYAGKTTFIRDLIKELSFANMGNIVVIDERNEICAKTLNKAFNLGDNVDVLTYASKSYGFNQAIRTLNPDYIAVDELMNLDDAKGVLRGIYGGIKVIATVHADGCQELKNISFMKDLIINKAFDKYVFISNRNGDRSFTVFNKDLEKLCSF